MSDETRRPWAQLPRLRPRGGLLVAVVAIWLAASGVGALSLKDAVAAALAVPAAATDPGNPCPATAPKRTFSVSLINIPIFLNRFGDVVPAGRMYILDSKIAAARADFWKAADPFHPKDIIEPLALRANLGDCVEVRFTNRLNEPAPSFDRDKSIFLLPGEKLLPAGTVTPGPREFAPALSQPHVQFDPANAPDASMHFTGLKYDVRGSDGTAVGNNPNSTVNPGAARTYRLFADREGEYMFQDGADLGSHETSNGTKFLGSNVFGAFGAMIVEPRDATWLDVNDGTPIESGGRAIIKNPYGKDFREHVLFMHDEVQAEPGILTKFCEEDTPVRGAGATCVTPTAEQRAKLNAGVLPALSPGDADALVNGEAPVKLEWFAFNYRSEPGYNRDEVGCPEQVQPFKTNPCHGEGASLSSWPYGDPGGGDLVFRNYRNEPMQIRLFHGAEQETHTFHWHIHRWAFDKDDEGGVDGLSDTNTHIHETNPLDVQSIGPGGHYSIVPEGGAGSPHDGRPGSFGDVIFHCHLYPHFADGMLGMNRIHDVLETGTNPDGSPRTYPDGTPVLPLVPLDDFPAPPAPTAQHPGFPHFMPGVFGVKAPKPPLGVSDRSASGVFPPTQLEQAAAGAPTPKPGAYFVDPCPAGAPLKVFDVAAIQLDVTYNQKLKWHNPQGRMYVLQQDKAAVLSGAKKPEPFSPLLNVGDCVEYHLTNELPVQYGGTVFDRQEITDEVSIHQHLVQFDVLTSDGSANGWNYDEGADPGQTITYRDFVSSDIKTNSFHDHMYPQTHQDAGLFGGSTVHRAGCKFFDPKTGQPVTVGTIVDVRCDPATDYHGNVSDGEDYRNAALFVEDHVPMFQPNNPAVARDDKFDTAQGVPIFPAHFPSAHDDSGAMGVNYRLEPFEARRKADPASLFSSRIHGDPETPLPMAYAGDRVKIRLFQLSHEESHGFNMHRFRWKHEPNDPDSNVVQAQHMGMLEYFDLKLPNDKEDANPDGLDLRDYLYYYGGADDWFLGAWGIMRVLGCDVDEKSLEGQAIGAMYGQKTPLMQLPDNPKPSCGLLDMAQKSMFATSGGNPCPVGATGAITAPIKKFTIVAIKQPLAYNGAGDKDPDGLIYVLEQDLKAVQAGTKKPEPLAIRVNAGDCVEVTLKNQLPKVLSAHCYEALEPGQLGFKPPVVGAALPGCLEDIPDSPNEVPGFEPFPVSNRVSLNAKNVDYHVASDGAAVGYNRDTTVGPAGSILYRWYAPQEGIGLLGDRGDAQNHLHHGLFGTLIVEPKGATYLNPKDGTALASGQEAVITDPNGPDFREGVILMNSDLSLFKSDGLPVPDNVDLARTPSHEEDDPEDQGEFSVGYTNEPWSTRVGTNPDLSLIFSSVVHGDPATPVFRAYAGDNVRLRVAQAQGDPRATGFTLHGHKWRRSPNDPGSQVAALQAQFNPGVAYNVHLDPNVLGGAGAPGDYLYRSGTLFRHLPGGQWGIFRVLGQKQPDLIGLPDKP